MKCFRGLLLALVFGIYLVAGQRCKKDIENFGEVTWSVEDEWITVVITVPVTDVWLGFGFGSSMLDSDSVAALDNSVKRLKLVVKTPTGVFKLPENDDVLTNTRNRVLDGSTVFEFKRPLAAATNNSKEVTFGENDIIWAIGSGPDLDFHTFENRGVNSITVNADNCPDTDDEETIPATQVPVIEEESVVVGEEVVEEIAGGVGSEVAEEAVTEETVVEALAEESSAPVPAPAIPAPGPPTVPPVPPVGGPSVAPSPTPIEEEDETEEHEVTEQPQSEEPEGTERPTMETTDAPQNETEEPTRPLSCDDCCEIEGGGCICCDEGEVCAIDGTGCTVEGEETEECPLEKECNAPQFDDCCPSDWFCMDNQRCKRKCTAHTSNENCNKAKEECCSADDYCNDEGLCASCRLCWLNGDAFDGECPCERECFEHEDCANNQFCQSPGACSDCSSGCNGDVSVDGSCERCDAFEEEPLSACGRGQTCPEGQYCGNQDWCMPCSSCRRDCDGCESSEVPEPSEHLPPTPLPIPVPVPVPEPSEQPIPIPVPVPVPEPSSLIPVPDPVPAPVPQPTSVPSAPTPLLPVPATDSPGPLPIIAKVNVEFYDGGAIVSWEFESSGGGEKKLLSRVEKFFSLRKDGHFIQLLQNNDEESCADQGEPFWIVIRMSEFKPDKDKAERIEFREDCDGDDKYDWNGLDNKLEYTFDVAVTDDPDLDYTELEFAESGVRGKPESSSGGNNGGCGPGCIAGAVIGTIAGVCIIGALVYFCWYKDKDEEETKYAQPKNEAQVPTVGPVRTALVMNDSDSDRSATPPAQAHAGEVEMGAPAAYDDDSDDQIPDVR